MQTYSDMNGGLSDLEVLALFDDNCMDPCSVVGSSYPESPWSNFLSMPDEASEQNSSFNLETYLMSDNARSEQRERKSNNNRSEDDLDELLSIDMSDFSKLQEESGDAVDLKVEMTLEFNESLLEDATSGRNIGADHHDFARPFPLAFKCVFCPRYFPDKLTWRHHNLLHCKKFLRCEKCKIRMRSSNAIRKHCLYHHIPMPRWKEMMIMVHDTV